MYATLQSDILRPTLVPARNHAIHPVVALAVIPNQVRAGHVFERPAVAMFDGLIESRDGIVEPQTRWEREIILLRKECKDSGGGQILVTRVILRTRDEYMRAAHASLSPKCFTDQQLRILETLPDWLWVCELTMPPIYTTNTMKLGEVVFDARDAKVVSALELEDAGDNSPGGATDPISVDDALMGAAVLIWFDGIWSSRGNTGGSDWPMKGLSPLLRTEQIS